MRNHHLHEVKIKRREYSRFNDAKVLVTITKFENKKGVDRDNDVGYFKYDIIYDRDDMFKK